MKQKLQIISRLDDTNFQYISKDWSFDDKADTLFRNLWSMFNVDYYKNGYHKSLEDRFLDALDDFQEQISVADFGWTEEVMEAFYKHPKNIQAVNAFKRKECYFEFSMWKLNSEPSICKKS